MRMIRTAALAAIGALALFIAQPANEALAHPKWPENVSMSYISSANDKVAIAYTNPGYTNPDGITVARMVFFNYCKAKDDLPPNWDGGSRRLYADSDEGPGMCKYAPRFSDFGLRVGRNIAKGAHTYSPEYPLAPGRYIISITLNNGDGRHHAGGNHTTLKLVELTRSN